ncbi:MAG TPA: galactose-1-phosphate uridylyltransferase [Solirubrobacteraceae bacterium]|nr:galactose-1-phosphate uridylyltransferase [Solirubrobacteraceae bacterium]
MSEQRFNELRGEPVVYAIDRQDRTFLPSAEHCPLCPSPAAPGATATPGTTAAPATTATPGAATTEIPFPAFEIAVFDNLFPAFTSPHGAAEVVVYTDNHHGSFATLPAERAEALMWVWRHRYMELGAREDIGYVLIFENRGVEVGVTLHHPHGQIYGYPFLPPVPALELAADERLGGCAVCVLLARELEDRSRVVYENDGVVAYVPYAARWPYEVHVAMRTHRPSLLDCTSAELRLLAQSLQSVTRGYEALFARQFPYVMVVHQAPTDGRGWGHLHVEFYPPLRTAHKLKYIAGSEQGAGTFIGDILPEDSAQALREAIARAG